MARRKRGKGKAVSRKVGRKRGRVVAGRRGAASRRKRSVVPTDFGTIEAEEEFELTATTKGWTPRRRD